MNKKEGSQPSIEGTKKNSSHTSVDLEKKDTAKKSKDSKLASEKSSHPLQKDNVSKTSTQITTEQLFSDKEDPGSSNPPEALLKEEAAKKLKPLREVKEIKLSGIYAFKQGMSSIYNEKGYHLPVTFLKVRPWFVTQVKNKSKDGYSSVQLACHPLKKSRSKSLHKHLLPSGFEKGARYIREIRQSSVENVKVGQKLSLESLVKGDVVKLRSVSKGHGFSGVVKRWGFRGGPASHGSKTHRTSGSIGNRTDPARVMPGKKMPGHYGNRKVTVINVQVVEVLKKEQMILVKGPVPGARNSLVFMYKSQGA